MGSQTVETVWSRRKTPSKNPNKTEKRINNTNDGTNLFEVEEMK